MQCPSLSACSSTLVITKFIDSDADMKLLEFEHYLDSEAIEVSTHG